MQHKAKKSLGQNFLKSQAALAQIIAAGELTTGDTVLEVGPGKGALTEKLLSHAGKVIAIEKDNDLFAFLSEKFANEIQTRKLLLIHADILEFNDSKLLTTGYKLIANIPYNITGAILKKFLASDMQPECMVLLVQKEVAERIVARDKKEGILSMSVRAYGTPHYIAKVPARYFSPAPKVDSAIIAIEGISRNVFPTIEDEQAFFDVMKAGFAHKRKMLAGNLGELMPDAASQMMKCGIDAKARAETLALNDWICLAKGL